MIESADTRDAVHALGDDVTTGRPHRAGPPLVIQPNDVSLRSDPEAARDWFASRHDVIGNLIADVGAVLLRGFPIQQTAGFAAMMNHFPRHVHGYRGGATPRAELGPGVYEATQVAASVDIKLHQEMAYLADYPSKLAFFCNVAAETGGETIIGDMRRFTRELDPDFVDELERRGVSYHRNFRADASPHGSDEHAKIYHATLEQGFGTTDRSQIEEDCRILGMDTEWLDDGSLSITLVRDAFASHPVGGDRVYFNHILTQIIDPDWLGETYEPFLDLYDRAGRPRPYHVTYGDGSPIPLERHRAVDAGLKTVAVGSPWESGDVMIVDNVYTAHGRNPFTGHRDVQVALLA